jgi:outer membrane protein
MLRFSRLHLVVATAGCLMFVSKAAAQTKVAVVSLQQAILGTAEIKKAQADMEAKFKPRQAEIQKLQKELQDIQNQLQTMQGKLTQQAEQDLTFQGQRKQRDLQRLNEDLQAEVDRERNRILAESGNKMQAVIQKLAEAKAIDVVIDITNTVYFKPALDLTQEATAAYDKAHPVASQ